MIRTILICVLISASTLSCSTAGKPVAADAKAAKPSISPTRTYNQKDLEQTGQTNVGDALQMLDPSISVHH